MSNIKKCAFSFFIITSGFSFMTPSPEYTTTMCKKTIDDLRNIVDHHNNPSQELLAFLDFFTIAHNGSLTDIVEKTQNGFLRPADKDRWQLTEKFTQTQKNGSKILSKNLGLVDAVNPLYTVYDHLIILGSTATTAYERLIDLVSLWKQGIRSDALVFLGSERPLDQEYESAQTILELIGNFSQGKEGIAQKLPRTETELLLFLWNHITVPTDLALVQPIIINAPMNGTKRATTADTIVHWLKTNPKVGRCLFISSQPFVGYQDAVIQGCMPAEFIVDTVGRSYPEQSYHLTVVVDTVARWLYQLRENK